MTHTNSPAEEHLLVLTTVGSEDDATRIARELVEARLAACVNVVPGVRSFYRWKRDVEEDAELLLLIKTTGARVDALRDALTRLHPYELPEFVALSFDRVGEEFGKWIANACG
jgi:periplasmic divalent cation tolerance protein